MNFTSLHNHSEYSIGDGYSPIEKLVKQAAMLKYKALAITEHGNLNSVPRFLSSAKEHNIKPIIGMEAYFVPDRTKKNKEWAFNYSHIILLAQNLEGYKNLVAINNIAQDVSPSYGGFYYKPRLDWELLNRHNKGLIVLSACVGGIIAKPFLAKKPNEAIQIANRLKIIFGKRFFLELQLHDMGEQQRVNKFLLQLSEQLDIECVVTCDAHYTKQKEKKYRDLVVRINRAGLNKNAEAIKYEDSIDSLYLADFETLELQRKAHKSYLDKTTLKHLIKNTGLIADSIENYNPRSNYSLPFVKDGKDLVLKVCEANFKKLVPQGKEKLYRARLEQELELIINKNFIDYFAVVYDVVSFARKNNILVGPRGSSASSLVSYLLGITNLDPIQHKFVFERFLSPERIEPPDIDMDFPEGAGRDTIVEYVKQKYKMHSMATYARFGLTGTLRDLIRVHKIKDVKFPKLEQIKTTLSLDENIKRVPELKVIFKEHPKLLREIRKLKGNIRHVSKHASGFVITNPLLPLLKTGEVLSAAWSEGVSYRDLSDMGHVKFDILGTTALATLIRCLRALNLENDFLYSIKLEDQKVLDNFKVANMLGVFEFDTYNGRRLSEMILPNSFSDLVAINALNRPGPLDSGMDTVYQGRKNGTSKWIEPDKNIRKILKSTYGVLIFQEQIMFIASDIAGFKLKDTEKFRKDLIKLGKSTNPEQADQLESYRKKFISGCLKNGLKEKKATRLFEECLKFARYGFSLSHSTAYSMIGYWMMWFKVYYPAVFYAACISGELGGTNKQIGRAKAKKFISEASSNGLTILYPNVNDSKLDTFAKKNKIQLGLDFVEGLGLQSIRDITSKQPFANMSDFLERIEKRKVNVAKVKALELSDCFVCFN